MRGLGYWMEAAALTFQGPIAVAQQPFRVVVAQERDAEDWDPPVGWQTESEWIELNAYDCLLFRNADHSGFVPGLATRWERVNDLTTRFYLRPNVRFRQCQTR